jgi:hypothetical protein
MSNYRCYLTRFGKIAAFDIIDTPRAEEAMLQEEAGFLSQAEQSPAIEIWELGQRIYIHGPADNRRQS